MAAEGATPGTGGWLGWTWRGPEEGWEPPREGSSGPRWACRGKFPGCGAPGGVGEPARLVRAGGLGGKGRCGVGSRTRRRGRGTRRRGLRDHRRGRLHWLGRPSGRGRARPAAGGGLARCFSFGTSKVCSFLPTPGFGIRGHRSQFQLVPRCPRMETLRSVRLSCPVFILWFLSAGGDSSPVEAFLPSAVFRGLSPTPALSPLPRPPLIPFFLMRTVVSQRQTEEMFSSCFMKGVRLLSSFSLQPGSV